MQKPDLVWVIDDDRSIRWVLERALEQASIQTRCFEDPMMALEKMPGERPDAVITDIRMPHMDGFELLNRIHERYADLPVIIMTAHSDLDSAVTSYKSGAFEYLPKPFDVDEAVAMVKRAVSYTREQLEEELTRDDISTEIIGQAPAMQEVFRAVGRLAQSNITVLINGESGTGKELVAQALHRHSPRAQEKFIALNMAAIPRELVESELFGHEKGAFTGASQQRIGRFEQANGGTLFLDEIGDMPAETQTRLLRVLAEGEFFRVGGHVAIKVDVRIIAATHQQLEELVQRGRFREDLFHRLNVIRIYLPRLSERAEDIPVLARHFLKQAASELNVEPKVMSSAVETYLGSLSWPGNVRQLENICRWLTVMAPGREVTLDDLPPELKKQQQSAEQGRDWEGALRLWADRYLKQQSDSPASNPPLLDMVEPRFEKILIQAALTRTAGRKAEAAELLGWGRNTLTRKLKQLGLNQPGD